VTISYADGLTQQRTAELPAPLRHDLSLLAAAEALFLKASARRVRIRAMRLVCTCLTAGIRQFDLFATPTVEPRQEALQQALDSVRARHGRNVVRWGRTLQA
jgi:hypothetical protein